MNLLHCVCVCVVLVLICLVVVLSLGFFISMFLSSSQRSVCCDGNQEIYVFGVRIALSCYMKREQRDAHSNIHASLTTLNSCVHDCSSFFMVLNFCFCFFVFFFFFFVDFVKVFSFMICTYNLLKSILCCYSVQFSHLVLCVFFLSFSLFCFVA